MQDIYNTILGTYTASFVSLPFRNKFHFASRLYLWQGLPEAQKWLENLRSEFTANDNPATSLRLLKATTLAPPRIGTPRTAYFNQFSELRLYERLLFRALFLDTVYGLDSRQALLQTVSLKQLLELEKQLLDNSKATATLSSFSINYICLLNYFVRQDNLLRSTEWFLEIAKAHLNLSRPMERQLYCYLLTHLVIGKSLFYSRPLIDKEQAEQYPVLANIEQVLKQWQKNMRRDVLYEFLVCCRIANYNTSLLEELERPPLTNGFITEPLADPSAQTIANAEHRNVLFLMAASPPPSAEVSQYADKPEQLLPPQSPAKAK